MFHNIWIITKRELNSFFDSLVAYVLIILFLGLTGFFTWMSATSIFYSNQANLNTFFGVAYWGLFLFIPAVTMRSVSEELRTGTIELLSTKAVTYWEIIGGKFLSCLLLVAISIAFTFPYYVTVASLGSIDHGSVWCGYLALILVSGVYVAIGILASTASSNQIVAFLLAMAISLFFQLIFLVLSNGFTGVIGILFNYLSMDTHFNSLYRGVVDSRDLIFFGSLTYLALHLAVYQISFLTL